MKYLAFYFPFFAFWLLQYSQNLTINNYKDFKLSYTSVGFGSNRFIKQPNFIVNRTQFTYTLEEAWRYKNTEQTKPDTILTGSFRSSSIDSIISLVRDFKDTVIRKFNPHIMSGGIDYIEISNINKKIRFELDNETDSTAEKIVAILNSYISDTKQKLLLFGTRIIKREI